MSIRPFSVCIHHHFLRCCVLLAVYLYQLSVNFDWGTCFTHKTRITLCTFFRGTKVHCCCHYPIRLPSDLVRHLLHVTPTTSAALYRKKSHVNTLSEQRLTNQCCAETKNCWRFTFSQLYVDLLFNFVVHNYCVM